MKSFVVGVSPDLEPEGGRDALNALGMSTLAESPATTWEFLRPSGRELTAEVVRPYDAIVLLKPTITAAALAQAQRLCLVARWGVGYDNIDLAACTNAGVVVTITPDAIRRPVASGAAALILALAHGVVTRDHSARNAGWRAPRIDSLGVGLTGRVLGVVGLGNIGRELLELMRPFGMRYVASDPYVGDEVANTLGAELAPLDDVVAAADVLCLTCALTPETYHLLNAERIARMKAGSFLVNVARGAVVDQSALVRALQNGSIRGAALDTLDPEPPPKDDPIFGLDNVILAPHSTAWTDQLVQANSVGCCRAILDLVAGRRPQHVVNPEVFRSPRLADKLARHDISLNRKAVAE